MLNKLLSWEALTAHLEQLHHTAKLHKLWKRNNDYKRIIIDIYAAHGSYHKHNQQHICQLLEALFMKQEELMAGNNPLIPP
jgi:hypothetical protein